MPFRMKVFALLLSLVLFTSGCITGGKKTTGGTSTHSSATGAKTVLQQSQDPKDASATLTKSEIVEKYILPPNTVLTIGPNVTTVPNKTNIATPSSQMVILVPSNSTAMVERTIRDQSETKIGAAQKDVVRETIARLQSLQWITWVGVGLFIFGLASLFWLPLKAIIASTTTSLAIAGGGLLLIVLPTLVVGRETLIFLVVISGVAAYYFIHRYASKSTTAAIYKDFVDKNMDGIDDRLQKIETQINGNSGGKP